MTINAFDIGPLRRNVRAILEVRAHPRVAMEGVLPPRSGYPVGDPADTVSESKEGQTASIEQRGEAPLRPLGGWPKRLIDLTVALVALALASPVMLVITILIRATAGGPAIFAHSRVGFNGRPFICYKFRTMAANSEQVLIEYLSNNPRAAKEWEENRKLKHDPRITLLGQMLRKSSLDELPQLFNILRGDMSCVGPRPVVADELQRYGTCAGDYLRTRPGLTGLWQVTGRSSTDYSRRVFLDSHYVRNWSLWIDLTILVRTTFAVMGFDQTS